ncbi:MAG: flagellar hook-associated protein FlgK [Acidobacteriaceae bacterium]|nr:flagellar hook-associated protein FlgK [Acidobacteriaceae bacterium]
MSLNTSLNIAVQSLLADTGALQATNNNIANANTAGYSRQTVVLQEAVPSADGEGNGVVLEGYQSIRSEVLQRQIEQETQENGSADAQLTNLQQIETVFTTSTQDIGTQMSALFSNISSLSTDASSSSLRQAVLASAQNLATAFNTASKSLTTQQSDLNTQVTQDVSQINSITKQIAELNPQLAALARSGQDGGTLQDQQDQLVLSLSKLTSVSVTQTENGETITTGNGTALVVGGDNFTLQTTAGSDGMTHVVDNGGADITTSLTGGDLGGTITVRDQTIPGLLSQLDTLASQFGAAMNTAQSQGVNADGMTGGDLFNGVGIKDGAAGNIALATTDPDAIAASLDSSSGGNGNIANLTAVQNTKLSSGATPSDAYANLVYQVGNLTANANAESTATSASLVQLNDQRSSLSGVSIDEESANLIRYQQAYEAAARVVTTINNLFEITMSMGTNAAS